MSERTSDQGSASLDPSLDPAALHQLAQSRPDLWVQIIAHPNAYPGLLAWFRTQNRPDVQAALAARDRGTPLDPPQGKPKKAPQADEARPASEASPFQRPPSSQPRPTPQTPPSRTPVPQTPAPKTPVPQTQVPQTPGGQAAFQAPAEAGKLTPKLGGRPVPYASRVQREAPAAVQPRVARAPVETQVEDRTVLASRRRKTLGTLSFGADPVELVRQKVVIGRRLSGVEDSPDLQKVEVTDPSKTVSGTHAELTFTDGQWYVKDLDSTNGIYRVKEDGEEVEVRGTEPLEGDFYLGDVLFTLKGEQ